jgi:hypothetical protein
MMYQNPADSFPRSPQQKHCTRCGHAFTCGPQSSDGKCWCDALPPVSPSSPDADCLCPECLRLFVERQQGLSD